MALAIVGAIWLIPNDAAHTAENRSDVRKWEEGSSEDAPPVWWDCADAEQWLDGFTEARNDGALTEEQLIEAAREKYLGSVPDDGARTEEQARHELHYVLVHALIRSAYSIDAKPAEAHRAWAEFRRRCERSDNSYTLLRWLTRRAGADPFDMWRYLP